MDTMGYVLLVVGALVIGLAAQYVFRARMGYEWILTAIGAGVGGYVASEYSLAGLGAWGTKIAGMAIFPALIGALVVAAVVEVALYYVLTRQPAERLH